MEGDYRKAINVFHEISPATFDSLYYCGCARLELGDPNQINHAIENFNQALILSPEQTNTNIYYKRAFAYQQIGRYAEAIIDYTKYIQYNKNHAHKGYLSRGLVYSETRQYDMALKDIDRANIERPPPLSKYYIYCLARAQTSAGQTDEATVTFTKLADICQNESNTSSQKFQAYFYYGIALYELKKYSTALTCFVEAFKWKSNRQEEIDTRFYRGLTQYALGDIDAANKDFGEVLTLDKNHTRTLFRLGMIQSQNDELQLKALEYLTQAHQLTPHRSDILYERGELHYNMGQLDACIRDKQLALQLEHTSTDLSVLKDYCKVR